MRRKPQRFGEIFSDPIRQQTYVSETTLKKKTSKAEMATIFKLAKAFKICITKQNGKQRCSEL